MPGTLDLDVDTYWIRRAAGKMEDAAQCFAAATAGQPPIPLPPGCLGRSVVAVATVALANLRTGQAHAAADQLHGVAAAVGQQLLDTAGGFDRAETAIQRRPR